MKFVSSTNFGALFQSDCLDLLRTIPDSSVHTIFADPPFNLGKDYGRNGSDRLPDSQYLKWCCQWLDECCRTLVPGGALFVYNLPKWLIPIGTHLTLKGMSLKHWIAVYKPSSLPIPNRLSPSHYGLLYYIKGEKARVFNRDAVRVPIRTCRHCNGDIKDYGGHKKHINSKGLNLTDVWDDVSSVRHRKYKNRLANELAPIIVQRAILLSTRKGDVVVDPFVGSGTTAFVAQSLGRNWICGDLNDCAIARDRVHSSGPSISILDRLPPLRTPRAFSQLKFWLKQAECEGMPSTSRHDHVPILVPSKVSS
jgi:site-specific DNA-methyltransferase (adenine-specific)